MPIADSDASLLQTFDTTVGDVTDLVLTDKPNDIRNDALAILKENRDQFRTAVQKEDREEVEAIDAKAAYEEARPRMDGAFLRIYKGLYAGVYSRQSEGREGKDVKDLSHYLDNTNPSTFAAATFENAFTTLERARSYADRFLPADTRPQITAFVDKVIVDVKAANQKLQKESREAQQALRDLDAARSKACRRYLSVRDLVSAALREAGSDVELSKVVPPLEEAKGRRPSRGSRGLQGGGDKQASNKA